jgi:hypothetical protein
VNRRFFKRPVDLQFAKRALSLLRFLLSAHIDTMGPHEVPEMFFPDAVLITTIE